MAARAGRKDIVALSASSVHFNRYFRNKSGKSIEEIAREEDVTERIVRKSVQTVEMFRQQHTAEHLNEIVIGMLLNRAQDIDAALQQAANAVEEIEVERNGKTTTVKIPDHATRLEAVDKYTELAKTVQPKVGPSIKVGVGIQTQVASGPYVGMEDRLREIRKKRQEQPQIEGRVLTVADLESSGGPEDEEEDGEE